MGSTSFMEQKFLSSFRFRARARTALYGESRRGLFLLRRSVSLRPFLFASAKNNAQKG